MVLKTTIYPDLLYRMTMYGDRFGSIMVLHTAFYLTCCYYKMTTHGGIDLVVK